MIRPKTRLKEVIPEECNRQRASRAQNTRAFKQQVFDVAPPVFSVCVSTRSRPKIRTRGEILVLPFVCRTQQLQCSEREQITSVRVNMSCVKMMSVVSCSGNFEAAAETAFSSVASDDIGPYVLKR